MWLLGQLLILAALLPQYKPDGLGSGIADFSFKSFKPKLDLKNFLPKIPKHIRLHIAAAFPEKDFQVYSKVSALNLLNFLTFRAFPGFQPNPLEHQQQLLDRRLAATSL